MTVDFLQNVRLALSELSLINLAVFQARKRGGRMHISDYMKIDASLHKAKESLKSVFVEKPSSSLIESSINEMGWDLDSQEKEDMRKLLNVYSSKLKTLSVRELQKFAGLAQLPAPATLSLALNTGATLTGKPDASEAITVVFSIDAWQAFDTALALQANEAAVETKQENDDLDEEPSTDPCPECGSPLVAAPGGGEKCSSIGCSYWRCF